MKINTCLCRAVLAVLLTALAAARLPAAAAVLEPFEAAGKWGFRDKYAGTIAVPPLFDKVAEFREGLAPVQLAGKWGYMDENGAIAVEPRFAQAGPFAEGVAEAMLPGGEWQMIDNKGKTLFSSGAPALGVPSEGMTLFVRGGRFGYMDARGKEAVPAEFQAAGPFSEGLAPVKNEKWGFIDRSGKFRIAPEFDEVRGFNGGLAAFSRDGKWGFLGKNGKAAVKNVFHGVRDFSEGLAAVLLKSHWAFIDKDGRLALGPEYSDARSFSGGLAPVLLPAPAGDSEPVPAWVDMNGAVVYRGAGRAGDGLEVIVSTDGLYGLAENSRLAVRPAYEAVSGCSGGLCLVRKDGRQLFVDHAGSAAITTDFDEAVALGCGAYRVRLAGKYGVMTSTGFLQVPAVFDAIEGSACSWALDASSSGATGRLDPATGEFSPGFSAKDPPPIRLSEKCLGAEAGLHGMQYADIPAYCGAEELRSILRKRPDCLNCRLALAHIFSSDAGGKGPADTEAALEALAGAIALSTEPAGLHKWRVELMVSSPPSCANADRLVEDYERLIQLEPANTGYYLATCRAYGCLREPRGTPQLPLFYCGQAMAAEPKEPENYLNRGNYRRLAGDAQGALEDYKTAMGLAPAYMPARLARARLSAELGQDFRTVFDYSKVLELEKENYEALLGRGLAYIRMGLCAKALPDLEAAAALRPGPESAHARAAYSWRCENDVSKTASLVAELMKPSEKCGGGCWRQDEYELYLKEFYQTTQYQLLLSTGGPAEQAAPAAAPASTEAARPAEPAQPPAKP